MCCHTCIVFTCCFCVNFLFVLFFFFVKQKTAYEMRISDWSSDVCSSDLHSDPGIPGRIHRVLDQAEWPSALREIFTGNVGLQRTVCEIGRASCRERVCQYV